MTPARLAANRANGKLGGRPKGHGGSLKNKDITSRALKSSPAAFETLLFEMNHCENPSVRVACAKIVLEYAHGKPRAYEDDLRSSKIINQLMVITGVPEPEPDPEPEIEEIPEKDYDIEGEVVKESE
jgi:hypothetical protein